MKKFLCSLFIVLTVNCAVGCGASQPVVGTAEIPVEQEPSKYVALTFDDGPRADTTARLLDGLLERGAAATFFVIGEQIPGNEDLLRRMAAEGHQI